MPSPRAALIAVGLAASVAGCDEPGRRCRGPFIDQRDPETLACTPRQLASPDCPDIPAPPPWPACKHGCLEVPDEAVCITTPGCRVVRDLCDVIDDRCAREGPYLGCLPIGTAGAAAGTCGELDAEACATRDDCGAQYLHGPECPPPPEQGVAAPAAIPPDGLRCTYSFLTCFDELDPP